MKKILTVVFILAFIFGVSMESFASDWDKAGKVLTVIEGLRLLTAGKVDFIGTLAGIGRDRDRAESKIEYEHRQQHPRKFCRTRRVWVPHYVWKREYIPEHREFREGYGEVIVEGYYIRYQVEDGGHWEVKHYWD